MKILLFWILIFLYACSNSNEPDKKDKSFSVNEEKLISAQQSEDICTCSDPEYKLKGCDYGEYRLKPTDFTRVYLFSGENLYDNSQEINSDEYFVVENVSKEVFLKAKKTQITAYDKESDNVKFKINGILKFGCETFKDTIDPNDEYSRTFSIEGQVSEYSWFLVSESAYESLTYKLINKRTCDTIGYFDNIPLIHSNGRDMFSFEYSPYEPTSTDIYRYQIVNADTIRTKYRLNFKKDISFSSEFISSDGWIYFINEVHYRNTGPMCNICDYYRIKFKQ